MLSVINNLNAAAALYSSEYWEKVKAVCFTENGDVMDEPASLRNEIIKQCTCFGGNNERGENLVFKIAHPSIVLNDIPLADNSLKALLKTNSIGNYRNFISEQPLLGGHVTLEREFKTKCIGPLGNEILNAYYFSVYGERCVVTESLTWAKLLSTILFKDAQKANLFVANNPVLELISNDQESILGICINTERILEHEYPTQYNSYILCGLSICSILTRWLRQLFVNILDIKCIFQIIALVKEFGINTIVFICVLLLKKQANFDFCQEYTLEAWISHVYEPIDVEPDWILSSLDTLKSLDEKHKF